MKPGTREWAEKAEDDWVSAGREYRARKHPCYDAACFHAQQCVEKYMKALLEEHGITFQKTHNLIHLLELMLPFAPEWEALRPDLHVLNLYSVAVRYPGGRADRQMAHEALALCTGVRDGARQCLNLPSREPLKRRRRR